MRDELAGTLPRALGSIDVSWDQPGLYTALGNLYFASREAALERWNYDTKAWEHVPQEMDEVTWEQHCAHTLKVHFNMGEFGQVCRSSYIKPSS